MLDHSPISEFKIVANKINKTTLERSDSLTDKIVKKVANSKSAPVMGKYNLRKKSIQSRSDGIKKPHQQTDLHLRGLKEDQRKTKKRNTPSRYKRKNANQRERQRVQEMNTAFEKLKRILSPYILTQFQKPSEDKLTKIATLKHAMNYIELLNKFLNQGELLNSEHSFKQQNNLKSEESDQKMDKMDTLPDISFVLSSDELSSLSSKSNEDDTLLQHVPPKINLINSMIKKSQNTSTLVSSNVNNELSLNGSTNILSNISPNLCIPNLQMDSRSAPQENNLLDSPPTITNQSTLIKLNENEFVENRSKLYSNQLNNQSSNPSNDHLVNVQINNRQLINQQLELNQSEIANNNQQLNQTTIVSNNQTYPTQLPVAINNQDTLLQNQQPINVQSTNQIRFFVNSPLLSDGQTNLDSGFKLRNENFTLDLNNNSQYESNRSPKILYTSTPLLDKSNNNLNNHHYQPALSNNQLQSPLLSPIKCGEYSSQVTNYTSIKSVLLTDSYFDSLEDIENDNFFSTLSSSDDFDLIL